MLQFQPVKDESPKSKMQFAPVRADVKPLSPMVRIEPENFAGEGGCCTTSGDSVSLKRSVRSDVSPLAIQEKPFIASPKVGFREYWGMFRSRIGKFRDNYVVPPGLYAMGNPHKNSEVFVTANYKYSFDVLRKSLKGMDAWILVLNTKGINVWCAAGKGTFGTTELVARIRSVRLENYVDHRRVIVPQLGAPGVRSREVRRHTDFRVIFGPIRANDLPAFLENNLKATIRMRRVRFNIWDRFVLVPMEVNPYFRYLGIFLLATAIALLPGFDFDALTISTAGRGIFWFVWGGVLAYFMGTAFVPLLLPFIPFRSFALKGMLAGFLSTALIVYQYADFQSDRLLILSAFALFPAASSYLALQFTGSTAFTGMTGVQREIKFSLPYHLSAGGLGILFFVSAIIVGVIR